MSSNAASITEMRERPVWLSRQYRFSLFLATVVTDPESWWQSVLNAPPETEVTQRAAKMLRQEGDYEGGRLFLVSQPDRVDWVWQAVDKPDVAGRSPGYIDVGWLQRNNGEV
jgi:hypothetical protein